MLWSAVALLSLALLFSYLGWRWESRKVRPPLTRTPLVSVIIPSYCSPSLADAVESAKRLDYPEKEIIVVDDSPGPLPQLEGVVVIKNKQRAGKARSLNQAVARAKGEILYFLDSDTVTSADALKKLVPWFSPGVAAVCPKFMIRNKVNVLTRMISLEHSFLTSLCKLHMHFGSLIGFRGCGVAMRKDVLLRLGGWKETMIEDMDLAAKMVRARYKILFEPDAVVYTQEPSNWPDFKSQRLRWGKGSCFAFLNYYKFYLRNPQFLSYMFPYLLLSLAILGASLYQTALYLLPASFYLISAFSLREALSVLPLLLIPLLGNALSSATSTSLAGITHLAIVTKSERQEWARDLAYMIPYVFLYFPVTMAIYFRGLLSGVSARRKKRQEMDFSDWHPISG